MLLRLLSLLMVLACAVSPTLADTITYPNVFVAGTAAQASQVNANFNSISTVVNGNIDKNNIKSSAGITANQLDLTSEFPVLRAAGQRTVGGGLTGDSVPRVSFISDGKILFGPGGASAQDTGFLRKASGTLQLTDALGTTNKTLEADTFDARTNGDANGKYTLSTAGLKAGAGGASAQDILLKRTTTATLGVRNAADSADGKLTCGDFASTGNATIANLNVSSITPSTPLAVSGGGTGAATFGAYQVFGNNSNATAAPSATSLSLPMLPSISNINGFRLTCSNGNPVPASDVTGATNVYLTPYCGNVIALYDTTASRWYLLASAQASVSITAASGSVTDVFAYNNSGSLALELVSWSTTTARATALVYQDGVLVKSGNSSRRYVGSFYATGTNQTEDSAASRCVYNATNRTRRTLAASIPTNSWTYTSTTVRAANSNTTAGQGRVRVCMGLAEDVVSLTYQTQGSSPNTAGANTFIGLDSTSTSVSGGLTGVVSSSATTSVASLPARYEGVPGIGFHYLQALESINGSGTVTFYGNDNTSYGINGSVAN